MRIDPVRPQARCPPGTLPALQRLGARHRSLGWEWVTVPMRPYASLRALVLHPTPGTSPSHVEEVCAFVILCYGFTPCVNGNTQHFASGVAVGHVGMACVVCSTRKCVSRGKGHNGKKNARIMHCATTRTYATRARADTSTHEVSPPNVTVVTTVLDKPPGDSPSWTDSEVESSNYGGHTKPSAE